MLSEKELIHIITHPESASMHRVHLVAKELLSLREQLAELKALPPIGQIVLSDYDSDGTRTARVVCLHDQADWDNFQDGTLLFTESKPAAGLGVEDITEFMRKAFWRGFESARGTENSNIPADWKDSKPNLLLALKAKISGD
ncbi:hypothetical protein [Yersinia mollaretii]|uniref:hypothetical protein n=1 Tax=Yersinia mollaretii TaxID=33060 RepID=UPI000C14D259|nr:hypothetical protein [Yersinia mollaretii]MDA5529068.1 hypothetical protein [Yersinia mollaretii]MDR7875773.1 hypothetical protein [Yersinia mollaretii]PHZ29594.1 hypothetical protein CS537_21695 [Yersinia mollaretii]WQC76883.1 hypothetical protein U1Z61_10560 [Yersinia mollaretii]